MCILLQQHSHKLLSLRRGLVARCQLLEETHFHFDHVLATLRLEALEQLMRVFDHQSVDVKFILF